MPLLPLYEHFLVLLRSPLCFSFCFCHFATPLLLPLFPLFNSFGFCHLCHFCHFFLINIIGGVPVVMPGLNWIRTGSGLGMHPITNSAHLVRHTTFISFPTSLKHVFCLIPTLLFSRNWIKCFPLLRGSRWSESKSLRIEIDISRPPR